MKIFLKRVALVFLITVEFAQAAEIEIYAKVTQAVGNIAYSHKSELIYSNHPFYNPDIRVMKYDAYLKKSTPYPNIEWNTPRRSDDLWFDSVLGIRNDSKGVVWILDMGQREGLMPKLVGWNTHTNALEKIYYIPKPASIATSQLNDFVIDEKHGVFIIADEDIGHGGDGSKAALVIVDMKTGACRRVLEGDKSTVPENIPIVIDKKPLMLPNTKQPILVGVDGITADKENIWLYFAPLNSTKVYRIKIDNLLNKYDKDITQKVEYYAKKSNAGGFSMDIDGNLYMTYVESNSIGIIDAKTKKTSIFTMNKNMNWPDGVSYNKDGYMYVSAAQLPKAAIFNNGIDKTKKPFYIIRFKSLVNGIFGR